MPETLPDLELIEVRPLWYRHEPNSLGRQCSYYFGPIKWDSENWEAVAYKRIYMTDSGFGYCELEVI